MGHNEGKVWGSWLVKGAGGRMGTRGKGCAVKGETERSNRVPIMGH